MASLFPRLRSVLSPRATTGTLMSGMQRLGPARAAMLSTTATTAPSDPKGLFKSLSESTSSKDVLGLVDAHHASFNYAHASVAMHQLASGCVGPSGEKAEEVTSGKSFQSLVEAVQRNIDGFAPNMVGSAAWAFATLGNHPGERVMELLAARALTVIDDCTPQDVGNVTWGFATLGYQPGNDVMKVLAARAVTTIDDCTPVDIKNLTWGFNKLGYHPGDDVMKTLATRA